MSDWTVDLESGRANSSKLFQQTVDAVASLIQDEAYSLIANGPNWTAGLIVAQLAHKHGFEPRSTAKTELADANARIDRLTWRLGWNAIHLAVEALALLEIFPGSGEYHECPFSSPVCGDTERSEG